MRIQTCFIFFLVFAANAAAQKADGDSCIDEHTNKTGRCVKVETCQSAELTYKQKGVRPTFCAYTVNSALVCCTDETTVLLPKPSPLQDSQPLLQNGTSVQEKKRVSERKCEQYSREEFPQPDMIPLIPNPEPIIIPSNCNMGVIELIVGGSRASFGEFPYIAAIGWMRKENVTGRINNSTANPLSNDKTNNSTANPHVKYDFHCTGSLISPRFVLTAGQCTRDRNEDNPEPVVVRLGIADLYPAGNGPKHVEILIKSIHRHPDYKPPKKYNNLGLLELSSDVKFEADIRPACLWTEPGFGDYKQGTVTGWNYVDEDERITNPPKVLQKFPQKFMENSACAPLLPPLGTRHWNGVQPGQMCAKIYNELEGNCKVEPGSPLQVASKHQHCLFYVMGVAAEELACVKSQPFLYTRVSHYLDWIESIVWPGE